MNVESARSGGRCGVETITLRGGPTRPSTTTAFEQFVSADRLRVGRVLDLQPTRRRAVHVVSTRGPFADDPFRVVGAGEAEEVAPAFPNVIHVTQA